jgi:hypothetical protein
MEDAIRKMLFEAEYAQEIAGIRDAYLMEFAFGVDGLSTQRIMDALRQVADGGRTSHRGGAEVAEKPRKSSRR